MLYAVYHESTLILRKNYLREFLQQSTGFKERKKILWVLCKYYCGYLLILAKHDLDYMTPYIFCDISGNFVFFFNDYINWALQNEVKRKGWMT